MFEVKICGITSEEDAVAAARSGADAIGLNFFPQSPRYVAPDRARSIVSAIAGQVVTVGVFVNSDVRAIQETASKTPLDLIQLHGDESPDSICALQPRRVIRAYRYSQKRAAGLRDYLKQCRDLKALPAAVLLDAFHPAEFGGTGKTIDWLSLDGIRELLGDLPFILAGGMTPENVAQAIRKAAPDAVDVASGVESVTGKKDSPLMSEFVKNAKRAFGQD